MFIRTKMFSLAAARTAIAGVLAFASVWTPAHAQETVKIGLILPMTGGQASTGKQVDNAVKLYMQTPASLRRSASARSAAAIRISIIARCR